MLQGNTAYCVKLSGKDLLRYLNKTESAGLRNVHIITILLRKRCHSHSNKHFESWRENSWHRYVMNKLCHCNAMYTSGQWRRQDVVQEGTTTTTP